MNKPENKKSLLHKINDVFEDYVVSKIGDMDVLESVEGVAENGLGADFHGPESACLATDRPCEAAQQDAADVVGEETQQDVSTIGQAPDGWEASPLPEKRESAESAVWEALKADAEASAVPAEVPVPAEAAQGPAEAPVAATAGSQAVPVNERLSGKPERRPYAMDKSIRPRSEQARVPSQAPQESVQRPIATDRGNSCPEDFEALWAELACLRAGFTNLMAIAYHGHVGSLREMQRNIRRMQLILQSAAERSGYCPDERPGECSLPRDYGHALRVMNSRILKLYDCITQIVLQGKADYNLVVISMMLMRMSAALKELS